MPRSGAVVLAACLAAVPVLPGCGLLGELLKDYRSGDAVGAEYGVLLYGRDVLTPPGREVALWARLRTPHAFRGIEKVTVAFSRDGQAIGQAVTDKDGIAVLAWRPPGVGDYTIHAQPTALPPDVDHEDVGAVKTSYKILVCVRSPQQQFLVTDLDGTLVEDGRVAVLTQENPRRMPHSVEALQRLAEIYGIIYLTARPDELTRKTRHWLRANRYPPGILITCEHPRPNAECRFKTQRLADLRRDFPALCAGVGDQASDVEAYLSNDMTPYLLQPAPKDKRDLRELARDLRQLKDPGRVQAVQDWLQVEEGILHMRRFSVEDYAAKLERMAK